MRYLETDTREFILHMVCGALLISTPIVVAAWAHVALV
jgi:hypothetical protein